MDEALIRQQQRTIHLVLAVESMTDLRTVFNYCVRELYAEYFGHYPERKKRKHKKRRQRNP